MPFVAKISVTHKLMKILKRSVAFLITRKGLSLIFLKHHLIPMGSNTPKDNGNFFHWLFEKFAISFIVFINQFKPGNEITFINERNRIIIFNMIPNSLDKRTRFKDVINIFATLITKIATVYNL